MDFSFLDSLVGSSFNISTTSLLRFREFMADNIKTPISTLPSTQTLAYSANLLYWTG